MAKILVLFRQPNQFPMAPPARSDSGLRPSQGQSRPWKPIWLSSHITYSKATLASQNLGAFNLKFEMRRTYQFSKRLRALPKFWRTLKQMDMESTECVPKDDFGFPKFGCLQLKVRNEKNLPVLKTTSGSALAQ